MKPVLSSIRPAAVLLAAGAVLLFAGCASNVNSYERAEAQAAPNFISDKRIIADNTLAGTIRVVSINQGTVSGNLLKIQATVENRRNSTRSVFYKFEWIDTEGMALDSANETWKTVVLQGRETTTLSTVAISPRAVDFRLKFRE